MAITAVGSPATWDAVAATTIPVSPTTVGNALLLTTRIAGAPTITAVSGGGVTTWTRVAGPSVDTAFSATHEMWLGTITATGSATITITFSASVAGMVVSLVSFEFAAGAGVTWARDGTQSGFTNTASSTNCNYPSLTATSSGELYYSQCDTDQPAAAGSTSGFTYVSTGTWRIHAYNLNVSAGAITGPTSTQSPAAPSCAIAVLITASVASGAVSPPYPGLLTARLRPYFG